MKILTLITALLIATAPAVTAQSVATLKKELRQKEVAAKKDVDALLDLADWAKDKGLVSDRRRILNAILKIDPENDRAHDMLGFVKYEGEWVTKSKAQMLHRKAVEAEMKEKGYVEVDGAWVSKDEEKDAKKGIFWHDGERVSKAEKQALSAGLVRHDVTGEFIAAADVAKAEQGLFPLGRDDWGNEEEADRYHSAPETPWLYRTHYATIVSSKPLADIKKITVDLDSGFDSVKRILGGVDPSPANRPLIHIAADKDEYLALGNAVGAEGSAYAVFLATEDAEVRGLGVVRPVIMDWQDDWGPYWMRHAAGLAYAAAIARDLEAELPLWFVRGVAGYAERHYNPGIAKHYGRLHLEKGGVQDVGDWFEKFEISGNLSPQMLDYNIYQAGLVLDFAMTGNDPDATAAMQAVSDAANMPAEKAGRALGNAVLNLQRVLSRKEDELREHLRKVTTG